MPTTHLDAAALRARVREAGAGTLRLNGSTYNPDAVTFGGAELAGALAAEGAGLTGLRVITVKLGADGWRAVFEALRKGACPRLKKIHFGGAELGPAGGAALAAALVGGGCPALTWLRVNFNDLGDAGFGALAEALGRGACPGMATLKASSNGLTVVPEALCGVASLEKLDLCDNDIGSLPHGLLHLARLRRLPIGANPRLAAERKIVGSTNYGQKDNDVGALFAHLRSVHGGEPPPFDVNAAVAADTAAGEARAETLALADKELPAGTPICVAGHGRGEYVSFVGRWVGANEHTIRFDGGGMMTLKLKEVRWSVKEQEMAVMAAGTAGQAAEPEPEPEPEPQSELDRLLGMGFQEQQCQKALETAADFQAAVVFLLANADLYNKDGIPALPFRTDDW